MSTNGRCFLDVLLLLLVREKYLNTLRQVEMMLKLWFPQISAQSVTSSSSMATSPTRSLLDPSSFTPPHKHRDQLHIPVKVRAHAFLGVQKPPWTNEVLKTDRALYSLSLCPVGFSRSADSAGLAQTPPRRPRCPPSVPVSVHMRGG